MPKKASLVLALASTLLLGGCYVTATGEKNGTITKLAQSGLFCKTWEMEIVRGGFASGTGVAGSAFDVTIEDMNLLKTAQAAIETGAEIRIRYRKELNSFCRSDSHSYFLTSIEILNPGIAQKGADGSKAPVGTATGSPAAVILTNAQLQQLLDNQTRSLDQNERLLKAIEAQHPK